MESRLLDHIDEFYIRDALLHYDRTPTVLDHQRKGFSLQGTGAKEMAPCGQLKVTAMSGCGFRELRYIQAVYDVCFPLCPPPLLPPGAGHREKSTSGREKR